MSYDRSQMSRKNLQSLTNQTFHSLDCHQHLKADLVYKSKDVNKDHTYMPRIIRPNAYHKPPTPTNPDNLTLLGFALRAFRIRWLNAGGIVQSATSL